MVFFSAYVSSIVVTLFEVSSLILPRKQLHQFDVAPQRVAMHLLVALVAKHDAVADRKPKFGESCEAERGCNSIASYFKRLSAMWATSASFVQLALVLDAMVLRGSCTSNRG